MKDLERDVLACYVAEERPPPGVDEVVRARIHNEARSTVTSRWIGVYILAVAAILLIWILGPRIMSRQAGRDDTAAAHNVRQESATKLLLSPGPRTMAPAPPTADDVPIDGDPGVAALRTARKLLRVRAFEAVIERLEPCIETVGADDLLEECEFYVIQALCGAGERDAGRTRIKAFQRGWPRSLHTVELAALCP